MGAGATLTPRRDAARVAVGTACLAWGVALLLATAMAGSVPARDELERVRGTVEDIEAVRGGLHFTLAGQERRLRYLRRAGAADEVRRLLEEGRSAQLLLLADAASGIVFEVEGASATRRYHDVRGAWEDKAGTDIGLGLAFVFVGGALVFGRPRPLPQDP